MLVVHFMLVVIGLVSLGVSTAALKEDCKENDEKDALRLQEASFETTYFINIFENDFRINETHVSCGDNAYPIFSIYFNLNFLGSHGHAYNSHFSCKNKAYKSILIEKEFDLSSPAFLADNFIRQKLNFPKFRHFKLQKKWWEKSYSFTEKNQCLFDSSCFPRQTVWCKESEEPKCRGGFYCDGIASCDHGEDEDIQLCRYSKRNISEIRRNVRRTAIYECEQAFRPDEQHVKILARLCDGYIECRNGVDENCDIEFGYNILAGLLAYLIAILASYAIFFTLHSVNLINSRTELELVDKEEESFGVSHEDEFRNDIIAFNQGRSDRRMWNQALVAFEKDFHGSNEAEAFVCLKNTTDQQTLKLIMDDIMPIPFITRISDHVKRWKKVTWKKVKQSAKRLRARFRKKTHVPSGLSVTKGMVFKDFTRLNCKEILLVTMIPFKIIFDMAKDFLLLTQVVVLLGGHLYFHSEGAFTSKPFGVIMCLIVTIVLPLVLFSLLLALECPGAMFGRPNAPEKKKKYYIAFHLLLFPFVPLIFVVQHALVECKLKKIRKMGNKHYLAEFRRLKRLNEINKLYLKKFHKMEISTEMVFQLTIQLILKALSYSAKSHQGLEDIFRENDQGITASVILTLSILWSIFSILRRYANCFYLHRECFSIKSRMGLFCYVFIALSMRIIAIMSFFAPILELFDYPTYQWGQVLQPIAEEEGEHGLFFFFLIFMGLILLHIVVNWIYKMCFCSRRFSQLSYLNRFVHAIECTHVPAPVEDWCDGKTSAETVRRIAQDVRKEVFIGLAINFVINSLHLIPIFFSGYQIISEGREQYNIPLYVAFGSLSSWIFIGSILAAFTFHKLNTAYHPFSVILQNLE